MEADGDGKQVRLAEDKEIRVAVIDDGVNIDCDDIAENVEEGETFCDNAGHWPGYYQSSYGHGHLMACLIRDLCPRVKLYVAKLNEMWVDGRPRITPESAAKVSSLELSPFFPFPLHRSIFNKPGHRMGALQGRRYHLDELDDRTRRRAGQE